MILQVGGGPCRWRRRGEQSVVERRRSRRRRGGKGATRDEWIEGGEVRVVGDQGARCEGRRKSREGNMRQSVFFQMRRKG